MAFTLSDGEDELDNQFSSLPASNPASPFFVPPAGTYQNNAGQIVPNSTASSTFSTPSTSQASSPSTTSNYFQNVLSYLVGGTPNGLSTNDSVGVSTPSIQVVGSNKTSSTTLQNIIFIVIGLILIVAGLFTFKTTQQVVDVAVKTSKRAAEIAAA